MLEQGTVAVIVALGGVLLLLLAGTQILDWYWPLFVLAVAAGLGWLRLRERLPTSYEVAQRFDERLALRDTVSTAFYFSDEQRAAHVPANLVTAQRRRAQEALASAGTEIAAPYSLPRYSWACLALVLAAGGLLVMRYGLRGSLDLRQPLVRIPFDSFLNTPEQVARQMPLPKQKLPKGVETVSVPSDGPEQTDTERKKAAEDAMEAQAIESDEATGQDPAHVSKDGKSGKEGGDQPGEGGEKGEGESQGEQRAQNDSGAPSNSPQKNAKSPGEGGKKGNQAQSSDNASLMDKMRDAMQSMLSRMKMNPQSGEMGKQNMASQKGGAQSASAQKQGQKGAQSPGKQGEGQSRSDEAGEQQGEGASKNMDAQGKMSDAAGEKQAAQEGKSGAGKQDGEKDLKDAEQAAAMGKISELLGKRAQNVTGEIMVEVSSGRQQLKTEYQQKSAAHADAGGESNRDEIPAAYQQFVQNYFNEIRKAANAAAAKPKAQ